MPDIKIAEHLEFFATFSFHLRLIGFEEYRERIAIARWLDSDSGSDPRGGRADEESFQSQREREARSEDGSRLPPPVEYPPDVIRLVALNVWYFTMGDPDAYPSVPHGHFRSSNRAWPKLNPYTGRVYAAKDREDTALRLSKHEMRELWRDSDFRNFCRTHIMWFMQTNPFYKFMVSVPLRLPVW